MLRNGEMPAVTIDVPDGGLAVTFRDSAGNMTALSFIPWDSSHPTPPQCLDLKVFDTGWSTKNGQYNIDLQRVVLFTPGSTAFRSLPDNKVSMITVLFPHERDVVHVK